MAETAIVLSFTLLLLFGTMQIGLAGYYQMQLDGAGFEYAHQYALGATSATDLSDVAALFPNVPSSNVTFTAASPPLTSVPVNYTQWGTLTNRYGGASIIRPTRMQAQTKLNTGSALWEFGSSKTFTAGAVEGQSMVSNHDDDAQGAGYDSTTVYNSQVNPLQTDDQNVPPYFLTFAFQWYCNSTTSTTCPNASLHSLGLAEYLKDGASGVDGNYTLSTNGIGSGAQFYVMACHQRYFANLAAYFPSTIPANTGNTYKETSTSSPFATPYSWDINQIYGEGFSSQTGQEYPQNTLNGC
jgi:hypothetical protein